MEVSDVPPALRERLGADATAGLLDLLDATRQEWTADMTTAAVERFERRLAEFDGSLRAEIASLRLEVREGDHAVRLEIAAVRQEIKGLDGGLRQEIKSLEGGLRQEIAATRVELLKWSFAFWVGQVFAVAGVVALVLRAMR